MNEIEQIRRTADFAGHKRHHGIPLCLSLAKTRPPNTISISSNIRNIPAVCHASFLPTRMSPDTYKLREADCSSSEASTCKQLSNRTR